MEHDEIAEAIRQMQASEGWELIERFICGRIAYHKDQLMHCDLDDVIKHRERVGALESVFLHINELLEEGEHEQNSSL